MFQVHIGSIFEWMGMDKEITYITDRLLGKIDLDQDSYSPKDLLKAGIPNVIIEQVRIELAQKIQSEIKPPKSKWLNLDHQLIQDAWKDFITTAKSHSCLPKNEIKKVIGNAVALLMKIYVQPRLYLAEHIFDGQQELEYDELVYRTRLLTVYKHFATAIPLYMKKRGLESMTLERCKVLIQNLDEKMISTYSAANWGQKLELLFSLYDDEVDIHVLSIFFEDKGLFKLVKFLNEQSGPLSKEAFVALLTSPSEKQPATSEGQSIEDKDEEVVSEQIDALSAVDEQEQSLIDSFFGTYDYQPIDGEEQSDSAEESSSSLADQYKEELVSDTDVDELVEEINILQSTSRSPHVEATEEEEVASLNSWYFEEDASDELSDYMEVTAEADAAQQSDADEDLALEEEKKKETNKEGVNTSSITSIMERAASSWNELDEELEEVISEPEEEVVEETEEEEVVMEVSDDGEVTMAKEPAPTPILEEEAEETIEEEGSADEAPDSEEEKEPIPVWQQFLTDDHIDLVVGNKKEEQEEPEEEVSLNAAFESDDMGETLIEEDEVVEEGVDTSKLEGYLSKEREQWVDHIFLGAEHAYEEAINDLSQIHEWKAASQYIQSNIFERNQIEMTSDVAVGFIDLLQSYFKELN